MKRLQAFKFELRPDGAQRQQMRCFAGSCRFVYNKGLALQKARVDSGEKRLSYFAQRADFPRFKKKGQHNSFRYPDRARG